MSAARVVHFIERRATAARYLLRHQPLDAHPFLTVTHDGPTLTTEWDDRSPWSTGERVLLNLLASIGNKRDDFAVADLDDLDYATRLTAVWAIGIAAGAWSDYSTSPYPYRIQGVHQ